MTYENQTVDYVYNLLIQSFQENFNNTLRILPKSFIAVISRVFAGIFIILYKLAGWLFLQQFPDTASFKTVNILGHTLRPLVELGKQFGVGEPKSGTAWNGTIRVNAIVTGKTLLAGTQLKSETTGLVYNVSVNTGIESDTVEVPVYCTQAGIAGNLSAGETIKFVSPLGYIEQTATVTGTTAAGTDDEMEEHYRSRVKTGYGPQPQGGAITDYRAWAFDAPGVLQTYPYNDKYSPAGVLIYVAGDPRIYPDRIADRGLCVAVGEVCSFDPDTGLARKPLTAVLDPGRDGSYTNVRPVSVRGFSVSVTGVTGAVLADFGSSLKSELEIYFGNREPFIRGSDDENARSDSVTRNDIISVTNGVANSLLGRFSTASVSSNGEEIDAYTLGFGELCKLNELYINGERYED